MTGNKQPEPRRKKFAAGLIIGVVAISIVSLLASTNLFQPGGSATGGTIHSGQSSIPSKILLLSGDTDSQVEKALRIDPQFSVSKNIAFNATFLNSSGFKAVVISNYGLSTAQIGNLSSYYVGGGNIFIIFGPKSANMAVLLFYLGITATLTSSNLPKTDDSTGINYTTGQDGNPLMRNVQWSSAPSIHKHTIITNVGVGVTKTVFLCDASASDHPFLVQLDPPGSGGKLILFTPWAVTDGNNYQVEIWPYFNYFIFLTTSYLFSSDPAAIPSFAKWAYSPVPHSGDTVTIFFIVCTLGIAAFSLFFYQIRRSRRSQIVLSEKEVAEFTKVKGEEAKKAGQVEHVDLTDSWEQVGTHKQISGFLFGLFAGILLGIPQIILTGVVFPQWIMPFPQVAGWFDWIKQFFQAVWMAFDVGTSIALAKYFAQYRVKQPQKAVHYIQIFVWWQLLSGVVQIVSLSLIGSVVFPESTFAHLSWMVILHSLIQYPGFFVVFTYIFQGMQRTDLQNLGNLLYQMVIMLACQYLFILIFRFAFKDHPFGEAFWSGIGYCVGQYVAEWGNFFIMMGFYKKLGFSVSTVFRVDFTRAEFKEALVFGGKECFGHLWVPIALMFQVWLLGTFLPNYNEEMGLYGYANMLMQVTALVAFLTEGFLAPISEAHAHKKQHLLDFTLAQGVKWSNLVIFFITVLLAAIGQQFIRLLAGSTWQGAARFIPLMLVYSLWQPWTWLSDRALNGTGYTGRAATIWIIEQGGKMLLLAIFITFTKDIMIILYSHIPMLIIKTSLGWGLIRKKVGKPKLYIWNSWVAPAISAAIIYFILYALTFVFTGAFILVEFILAIFGFFYIYSFLCGFFGFFDENTIGEFKKAATMVKKPISTLSYPLYKFAEWGCRASPGLHNRYPLDLFTAAMEEAKELEREKVKLKI
jgi:O-antigen/teichoic acid export membrane protein